MQEFYVDATEQRIERPQNQLDYYFGKSHACTIKTKVVIEPKGRILRVSKPYEGRIHDFEIRKTEGLLPSVPILADSGYQGLQNEHTAAVILPKKKPKIALYLSQSKSAIQSLLAAEFFYIMQKQKPKSSTHPAFMRCSKCFLYPNFA